MRIFVLSLPKDRDKLERFRADLARLLPGSAFAIPEMYDARLFSERQLASVYSREGALANYGREIGKGEIGNIMSQQSVFASIQGEARECALIFEDDAKLGPRLTQAMPHIQEWLDRHAETPVALLLTQPSKYRVWGSGPLGDGRHRIARVFAASGNYGFIVNAKGAQALLELNTPISRHPDDWAFYHKTGKLRVCAVHPFLVGNYDFGRARSNLSAERYAMWQASNSDQPVRPAWPLRLRRAVSSRLQRLFERLTGVVVVAERSNKGLEE